MEYRVSKWSPEFGQAPFEVKRSIRPAGPGVMKVSVQNYTTYKASSERNCASLVYSSKGVRVFGPTAATLEPGFARDARNIGHWGPFDLELSIYSRGDVDKARP